MTETPVGEAAGEIVAAPSTLVEPRTVADAGLWETDLETGETELDAALERMYGFEPGEFDGGYEDWLERVHPDDRERVDEAWERAIKDDEPYHIVYRIVRDDGIVQWIDSRAKLVYDEDGEPTQMRGLNADITDSQERIQQLQVLDRVLRHNLRNDMTLIMGHAQNIAEAASSPVREEAEQILETSEGLLEKTNKQRVISDLLSTRAEPDPVDLVPIVEEAARAVHRDYPDADVRLDLPAEIRVSVVDAFDSAVEEIIRNAVAHNDSDQPEVVVTVTVDDAVRFRVADNGPGIPEMDRKLVTGEQRIGPLQHASGLGLWLVSWVVQRSGGTITFEENDPRGTVLTVEIRRNA